MLKFISGLLVGYTLKRTVQKQDLAAQVSKAVRKNVKKLLEDTIHSFVSRLLWGTNRTTSKRSVPYSTTYDRMRYDRANTPGPANRPYRPRSSGGLADTEIRGGSWVLAFESPIAAHNVWDEIVNCLELRDLMTVADLMLLTKNPTLHDDETRGWTDLSSMVLRFDDVGSPTITLPAPCAV